MRWDFPVTPVWMLGYSVDTFEKCLQGYLMMLITESAKEMGRVVLCFAAFMPSPAAECKVALGGHYTRAAVTNNCRIVAELCPAVPRANPPPAAGPTSHHLCALMLCLMSLLQDPQTQPCRSTGCA